MASTFIGFEEIEKLAASLPRGLDNPFSGFPHQVLELGEHLLDRVQVRAVGRQEQESGPDNADRRPDRRPLVAGQVVENNDVPRLQERHQFVLHTGQEALRVDRVVEYTRGIDPIVTKYRQEGHRFPVSTGRLGIEPLTPPRGGQPRSGAMVALVQVSSMKTSHVRQRGGNYGVN